MKKSQITLFILITVIAFNFAACEAYAPVSDDALSHADNHRSMLEYYNAIIQEVTEAIRLDPNDAVNYLNRAYAYYRKGSINRAIEDLNKGIQLQPDDIYLFFIWRGYIYHYINEYDLAIDDFTEVIQMLPECSRELAYTWRSYVYIRMGEYNLADADFYELIRLYPYDSLSLFYRYGLFYANKGKYDRAITIFSEAIQLGLDESIFYYERGWAYFYKGDYDLTIADINELLRLQPGNEWLYYYRSEVYRFKGDLVKAEADLARAKELGYEP